MPLQLTPAQEALIRALLQRHLDGVEVWAYGSRVTGKARPASDLDLVVLAGAEHRRAVAELREAFEESDLPFRVDLFLWDDLPESFRENIRSNHIVLQPKKSVQEPESCP
ncbi:conserved hypothetical protein [Methylomarinovum caldicuralii]|uniref:Polymerase beta nucleotidyltransferase domain-containing protein n=1 Tax=Methylomarinovum caldicuralii TaxID=438856 RepID=A0AAU9BX91_9GAMM|nr:nucleotidyltransferase domain-containing protein [Methylomarinovum caldicuralii]BCX80582.1 conserved hypothetical protein [Methylomarinovum caldicuralii]